MSRSSAPRRGLKEGGTYVGGYPPSLDGARLFRKPRPPSGRHSATLPRIRSHLSTGMALARLALTGVALTGVALARLALARLALARLAFTGVASSIAIAPRTPGIWALHGVRNPSAHRAGREEKGEGRTRAPPKTARWAFHTRAVHMVQVGAACTPIHEPLAIAPRPKPLVRRAIVCPEIQGQERGAGGGGACMGHAVRGCAR